MASHFRHLNNQNRRYNIRNGVDSAMMRNNTESIGMFGLNIEQLHRRFHRSLDLNKPMLGTILRGANNLSYPYVDKVGNGSNGREEAKRKWPVEMKNTPHVDIDKKSSAIDLSLRLSLPPPTVNYEAKECSSTQAQIISSSSSASTGVDDQSSCISSDMEVVPPPPPSPPPPHQEMPKKKKIPSLVVMGCSGCMMYVMVSEAQPFCPKCKTSFLIDMFRENPAKRTRRN